MIVSTTRPISCLTLRSRSGRADLPAEILRDDDVGGLLRPELRDLDVALLEDDLALLVADHRRADLPFDLVERIDPAMLKLGEASPPAGPAPPLGCCGSDPPPLGRARPRPFPLFPRLLFRLRRLRRRSFLSPPPLRFVLGAPDFWPPLPPPGFCLEVGPVGPPAPAPPLRAGRPSCFGFVSPPLCFF